MSIFTAYICGVRFVAPTSIVPCVTINRGIDIAARGGAAFELPITLTYLSNNQPVTINQTIKVQLTQFLQIVNPQAVNVNATLVNAPHPDVGSIATCTVNVTIKDPQQVPVNVFDPVTTTNPITQ
jgi:hypothetical protein